MSIGEFIHTKRKECKMSQRDLAAACELSNAEISRIESGIRKQPSAETLKVIARALKVNINELYKAGGYLDDSLPTNENLNNQNEYLYIGNLTDSEKEQLRNFSLFLINQR